MNKELEISKEKGKGKRDEIKETLNRNIKGKFFSDISDDPKALKKKWSAKKLKTGMQSLPDLNELMLRKIFIEAPERQWQQAENTIDTVTRVGPHVVVSKEDDNGHKNVFGTCRLKELSKPYQAEDPTSYRLYMQNFFIEGLLHHKECAFITKKIPYDLYQFLNKHIEESRLKKILKVIEKIETPEERCDYLMSQIGTVEFNQFLPTRIDGIIPLINHSARISYQDLGMNFINTTIEDDLVADIMFGIERTYNQLRIPKERKKIIYPIAANQLYNENTGESHNTLILLIDAAMANEVSSDILIQNKNMKVVRDSIEFKKTSKAKL
jgi:hypothetical protein